MANTKPPRPKTLAEQIAEVDDPAPRDFDPEDYEHGVGRSESGDSDAEAGAGADLLEAMGTAGGGGGREHYLAVGKSALREEVEDVGLRLGGRYVGARIEREAVVGLGVGEGSDEDPFGSGASARGGGSEGEEEGVDVEAGEGAVERGQGEEDEDEDDDIDSDEAFGEGDGERFKGFTFRGSKKVGRANHGVGEDRDLEMDDAGSGEDSLLGGSESVLSGEDDVDVSGESEDISDKGDSSHDDSAESVENDGKEDEAESTSKPSDERAEVRKIMAEEQKSVASTISQAAKADVDKGNAVKHQRSTFDSLLNTRIRLQKALIATNSIPALKETPTAPTDNDAFLAAEEAAINLWYHLDTLRHTLHPPAAAAPSTKRKRSPSLHPDPSTPIKTLWRHMQSHETTALPTRRMTLEKWSTRLRPVSALSSSRKLLNTPTTQPLTSVLDTHLSDMARLVARTRTPRSCAPLQAEAGIVDSADIFDDADFYTLLLRELVDQRMADSASTAGVSGTTTAASVGGGGEVGMGGTVLPRREAKIRKKVDTKASKGRKMRYTVHEKLQNFMASEDRGVWGDRQRDELFGGLLGRRVGLREDEGEGEDGEGEDGEGAEEGFRLFRG